ncbi:MAG: methyltransferase domain-containing protein [Spirochaetales bacterium]|nr:methyltransferase domain-containing protein [Spirochaetales bacterium]
MPTMFEIYKAHSKEYDELVNAEDYKNNLGEYLKTKFDWKNKVVYEAGIGTGRVTNYYISQAIHCYGFDYEEHMLSQCKMNHSANIDKMTLNIAENLKLKPVDEEVDVFIEGWSFGHTMNQNSDNLNVAIELLIDNIKGIVKENGEILIIESLGTNVEESGTTKEYTKYFYKILEGKYKFSKTILRTDYKFKDYKEASRVMGFFFGDEMKSDIENYKKEIIKEYTGVWYLKNRG